MGKSDRKWDDSAERDLCIAIILSNQDGSDRIRCNWATVLQYMGGMGYNFTKDAVSQHFTKVIMKDVKARHGSVLATPKNTPNKKTTKVSPKKRAKVEDFGSDEEEDQNKYKTENGDETPEKGGNKRTKRERSATVLDNDAAFAQWQAGLA